jgi:D-alanyl-lipoteichoic acid acyltransferase DltB (MBOAT superfamily)
MSFVSIAFLVLLFATFTVYHACRTVVAQNVVILLASYIFYGWWDWRILPLLFGLSVVNFLSAIWIAGATDQRTRDLVLWIPITASFVALGVFKYFGFFVNSFVDLFAAMGVTLERPSISIILPLGISFITFQGTAYVIDVWRGQRAAEHDLVRFLAFKSFFPQLVAGPIERASNLLDQFARPRAIDAQKIRAAIWLLIYGFFLKIVIADSMAPIVNSLFVTNQPFGWSVVLGTVAFGIQIYADFNGYSTIAKGAALLLGFDLVWNFRFPYWASSISEFWRRWHISLSNWLRDYLYIPLGGNRDGGLMTARNLLLTMTLGGLWHGASWNFVYWGLLHGIALSLWRFLPVPTQPTTLLGRAVGWGFTMTIVFAGWFLFRATDPVVRNSMIGALDNWQLAPVHGAAALAIATVVVPLFVLEWLLKNKNDFVVLQWPSWIRTPLLALLLVVVLAMTRHHQPSFIYFQF